MLFSGSELPQELVQAALNGRLVVFAGAGVSMQPKVSLPNFNQLVDAIREEVDPGRGERDRQYRPSENDEHEYTEAPEHYLGYLKNEDKDVHEACAKLCDTNAYAPLHQNLIELFGDADSIRLVTTNFDPCFENALGNLVDCQS